VGLHSLSDKFFVIARSESTKQSRDKTTRNVAHIGEEVHAVKAGDFIGYRAGGEAHSLTNTGDSVLKCIVVGQRLEHDVGDYPRLKKRVYRQKNMPWNLVDIDKVEEPNAGKKT